MHRQTHTLSLDAINYRTQYFTHCQVTRKGRRVKKKTRKEERERGSSPVGFAKEAVWLYK